MQRWDSDPLQELLTTWHLRSLNNQDMAGLFLEGSISLFLEGKPMFGALVVQCMKCLMENLLGMKSMTKFLLCFTLHHQMSYLLFLKMFQKKERNFYECASIESLLLDPQLLLYLTIRLLKMPRGNYESILNT